MHQLIQAGRNQIKARENRRWCDGGAAGIAEWTLEGASEYNSMKRRKPHS